MKKIRLVLFALLAAGGAYAQYFQHVYGSPNQDFLESGVNANSAAPQGHIMTGYTASGSSTGGVNSLMVTWTNLNGSILPPAPFFNNRYPIFENGVQVNAKGRRVVHPTSLGGNIGIWGDYGYSPVATGVSTKFFYVPIAQNGVPGAITSYTMPFQVVEAEATSMCGSIKRDTVYVCGFIRKVKNGPRYPIVMCIDAVTGAIAWANQYQVAVSDDWIAMDLVESPYYLPKRNPNDKKDTIDLAVTGHLKRLNAPDAGCFFLLSAKYGTNTSLVATYGNLLANGGFNAIDIANNPFAVGPGFVLGGSYNNPVSGSSDSWAMKVNTNGIAVAFSSVIDYAPTPPSRNDFGNDIIERITFPALQYEYYLGGYVAGGLFGGDDAIVYKLNAGGAPFILGQFTYGTFGNERTLQLDQYNAYGLNNNGLSVFGTTTGPFLGATDFYFVKSYFNGVTACNFNLNTPRLWDGPGFLDTLVPFIPQVLNSGQLAITIDHMLDSQICWAPMVGGGNNSRLASTAQEITQPGYFPNPVSRDNAVVTVMFGNEVTEGEAEIELWNSLGQLCWTRKAALANGQTNMQVELGNELSGGMYHLIVRQNGAVNNYRILVQ